MAAAQPYIARRPQLTIGGVTLDCHAKKAMLLPEDAEVDTRVFCKPSRRSHGVTTWTLEIDVLQSFGDGTTTEGLYDQLAPMAKTSQDFVLETDKLAAASETTPHFTGTCQVPSIPILDAEIGEKSEFTLTFYVEEDPLKVVS